jgi:DNA-binding MarR family transcriptional regulator
MASSRRRPSTGPPPSLVFLLSKLGFAASRSFAESLAPLGLEPRHFALLNYVALAEGQSQQELGVALDIPPSRMVAIVDDLEERGMVERRAKPSDRRARALYLTASGTTLRGKARAAVRANEQRFCASLAPATREQLIALLTPLAAAHGLPVAVRS